MHWFDWTALAVVVAVTIVQTIRGAKQGMGLVLYEALGLVVSAVGATALSGPLADAMHMEKAVVLIVLFLVFGVLAFVLAYLLFTATHWSFESLDGFLSCLFGLVGGWAIAHMVLRVILTSQGEHGELASALSTSLVCQEIFQFRTWNALLRLLFRAKLGPDFNPDVG
jgi:Co/Zn/Cd efflux system component